MIRSRGFGAGAWMIGLLFAGCQGDSIAVRCANAGNCANTVGPAGQRAPAGSAGAPASPRQGDSLAAPSASEPQALGVRFQGVDGMALDVVALGCSDSCAVVEAVAKGGNPPYTLQWDDGSTQSVRRVCGTDRAELSVRVTDTPLRTAEFSQEAQTVTASIQTRAFECSDAGTCKPGPGDETPEPGHYEGTGTYVCDNDMGAESAALINHLVVSLDFEIDKNASVQGGRAFFQWGLLVIAGDGRLEGMLECKGALRASLREGTWGLPGPEPRSVIPTGTVTGEFTARAQGEPGKIIGTWHWTSMNVTGAYGNMCNGTYTAQLTPP